MRASSTIVAVAAAVLLLHMTGCKTYWKLDISEVGKNMIELYLDEPADKQLLLSDIKLYVNTASGRHEQLDLGAFGQTMRGGTFLIVWEMSGYNGLPVSAPFSGGQAGAVPGIQVHHDFFEDIDSSASEIRIDGTSTRYIFPFFFYYYEINGDVVRFGTPVPARPNTGGVYQSNGNLNNPTGSLTLQRLWGGGPIDTNSESDWKQQLSSWGVPTP